MRFPPRKRPATVMKKVSAVNEQARADDRRLPICGYRLRTTHLGGADWQSAHARIPQITNLRLQDGIWQIAHLRLQGGRHHA
jgi:hypothetical protein